MTKNIDELAKGVASTCKTQYDFTQLFKQLQPRDFESALADELIDRLGYEKYDCAEERKNDTRDEYSKTKIQVNEYEIELLNLRDRSGAH